MKNAKLIILTVIGLGYCSILMAQPPSDGLVLWLKGDAGVIGYDPDLIDPNSPGYDPNDPMLGITGPASVGDSVGIWEDQSATSNDAWRTYGLPKLAEGTFPNGTYPVIDFSGTDGFILEDAASLRLEELSIYTVVNIDAGSQSQIFISNFAPTVGFGLGISDSSPEIVKWFTSPTASSMEPGVSLYDPNSPTIVTAVYRPDAGMYSKLVYFNGLPVAQGSDPGLSYTDSTTAAIGVLGDLGYQFMTGEIAEILVYNAVDTQQQLDVQSYLSEKYGIAMDPDAEIPFPDPDTITMTANTVFAAQSDGAVIAAERWHTYSAPGPAWSVVVLDGAIPGNTILNKTDGVSPDRTISVELQRGNTYTFTFGVSHAVGGDLGYTHYGLNVFFDKPTPEVAPDISVYASKDIDAFDGVTPAFSANSAAATMGYTISDFPGTGKLKYIDYLRGLQVVLSDFVIYSKSAGLGIDYESAGTFLGPFVPDGEPDVIGQYTLTVEDAIVTCSDVPTDQMFIADFNSDCYVNLEDLAIFVQDWLRCIDPANPDCEAVVSE